MAAPIRIEVDDELARLIGPGSTPGTRRTFLDHLAEHPPVRQIKGLFFLACQALTAESSDALDRLRRLTPNIVEDAYKTRELEPPIIDLLATEFAVHASFLGRLILNNELSEDAFHFLVMNGTDTVIETIRRRNMNLLNSPAVIEGLFENQKVRKGTIDRILQILGLEVKVSADDDEAAPEAASKAQPAASIEEQEVADDGPEAQRPRRARRPQNAQEEMEDLVQSSGGAFNPDIFRSFLEGRQWNFASELTGEDRGKELTDEERLTLFQQVTKMPVSEKIVLALRGNREARNLLLRDSNRLIPLYVLQNSKITPDEIAQVAGSAGSSRELISEISRNREWTKDYKTKRSLAVNPKTPLDKSMRFLNSLSYKDVRDISRSKNVPSALAIQAKRLVQRKQDTGKMTEGG